VTLGENHPAWRCPAVCGRKISERGIALDGEEIPAGGLFPIGVDNVGRGFCDAETSRTKFWGKAIHYRDARTQGMMEKGV